jgi:hypothetical protein
MATFWRCSWQCSPRDWKRSGLNAMQKLGMLVVAAVLAFPMLLVVRKPAAAQPPVADPVFANAVWVAESADVVTACPPIR